MTRLPFRRFFFPFAVVSGSALLLWTSPGARTPLAAQESPAGITAPAAPYDWLQVNGDPQHSGNNTQETVLGQSNVATLGFLFQATLASTVDGAPVALSGVSTAGGIRDLLFVTTKAGHIIALDASTGAQVWSHQNGPGTCKINNGSSTCFTTSSPAIDPNRQYVYSYGLDGYVHKYQVGDGTEITGGGWPQLATLKGFHEKGPSPLTFATAVSGATYLYVTNGGYPGDNGDYQGHVTAIDLATGAQKVFNAVCSDQTVHFVNAPGTPDCPFKQTAIWARVGVVYDGVTDRIYMTTGNGTYDGNNGGHEWSETVFSLHPDGTGASGKPLDTYTPTNYANLDSGDTDLGSTGPALLPAPAYPGRLAVQSGKDGKLRLINLENMSGQNGPGHTGGELQLINVPQGGTIRTSLAVWINPLDSSTWVFVTSANGASGLKLTLTGGVPALATQWQNTSGGFSPIIANNVLYYAGSGVLRALNPATGALLWSDTTRVGSIHWESPVVVNGRLYITDESAHLTAYGLPPVGGSPTATATNTPTRTPTRTPTSTPTRTATNTPGVTSTPTATQTPTLTRTPTSTPTVTRTSTPAPPTSTSTPTRTRTPSNTPASSPPPTATPTSGGILVPPLADFRDVRRAADINAGPDLGGTGHTAMNFTGSAGSGGDAWITVYDATPGTPDANPVFGNVNLSADVLIQTYNNKKGAGLLALFNEGTGKQGLALILYDAGNSDSLTLAAVDPANGRFTTLGSVSLGGNIVENAWYRVTMSVVASGGNAAVTGKVFRHTTPADPGSALGAQVGLTLNFNAARPPGVDATGEVGLVASAASTSVNSSVANLTIGP